MHRILLAFALATLPCPAQDEAKIKELIQKLDDDSFEAREQAEKELVALGEAAVPSLKKAAEEASSFAPVCRAISSRTAESGASESSSVTSFGSV